MPPRSHANVLRGAEQKPLRRSGKVSEKTKCDGEFVAGLHFEHVRQCDSVPSLFTPACDSATAVDFREDRTMRVCDDDGVHSVADATTEMAGRTRPPAKRSPEVSCVVKSRPRRHDEAGAER